MLAAMRAKVRSQIKAARPVRRLLWALALSGLLCAGNTVASADADPPTVVFAAASTMAPMRVLAHSFEREHGERVQFSFAASSTLARQVIHGARAGLFVSANQRWLDRLEQAGLLVAGSRRDLTGNRLALIRPAEGDAPVAWSRPDTLLAALGEFPLVLADPSHVPAGIYAREALERLDLWEPLQGRLAYAANARAVTVRVARGEAPLGITYASELRGESRLAAAALLPPGSHSPIRYELALMEPGQDATARAFHAYLLTAKAQTVFREHGFTPRREGGTRSAKTQTVFREHGFSSGREGARPSTNARRFRFRGFKGVPPSVKAGTPSSLARRAEHPSSQDVR